MHPPSLKRLLGIAWPIVVSRSSQVVVGFSDAVMVGSLGEAELAATTTGAFNAFLIFIAPIGTVFIVSSFAAQLAGKGRAGEAKRYGWVGLLIALLAGVVAGGFIPFTGPFLGLFPFADDVHALMSVYLQVRLLSTTAAVGLEALSNYYQGLGNSRLPMFAQIFAMVGNVFLNWVLIFGHLGAPALGVVGAAWASVIASSAAFLVLFACFVVDFGTPFGRAEAQGRFSLEDVLRTLRFGVPSGMNWLMEMAAFQVFVNVVVAGLGTTSLAALNAVIQLNSMAFMPAIGIGSAGAVLVGNAIGGKRIDWARAAARLTLRTCLVWMTVVASLYVLVPGPLIAAFADESAAEFRRIGVRMLMLSALWQVFDAVGISLSESLRAAGDTTFTMWARLIIAWSFFLPASFVTVTWLGLGEVAAVLCIVVYMAILATVLWRRWASDRWESLELVGEEAPLPEP